jgi:hypothetical protein
MGTRVTMLTDARGRVLAAHLVAAGDEDGDDAPKGRLVAGEGHRAIRLEAPDEIAALGGPDLHRYLSSVRIRPAEQSVDLPKIEIRRHEE